MTVVLVCGGRDFNDEDYMNSRLEKLFKAREPDLLVHGNAEGADKFSGEFALSKECNVMVVPAKWKQHGRSAGPIRNAEMLALQRVDLVVAFPGGTGTKSMMTLAEKENIKVVNLEEDYAQWQSQLNQ